MASSDESVHFVGESHSNDDPSEATSKRAWLRSFGSSSGQRWSRQQAMAAFHWLINEEDEEEGNEGEVSSLGE
ncbi:UNVERIFIED_CONTAM: hypothetical protein Sradi_6149400 [Sesamum radiatum]|uniref:Uncharacterized protein n=1 Tax=Sesamum radiatum TaxID=300843 RepID=A0AAW2KKF6_SESRA